MHMSTADQRITVTVYAPTRKAIKVHAFGADERIVFVEPGIAVVYTVPQNEVQHLGLNYRLDSHCQPTTDPLPQLYITSGSRTPGAPLPSREPKVVGHDERVIALLGIIRR